MRIPVRLIGRRHSNAEIASQLVITEWKVKVNSSENCFVCFVSAATPQKQNTQNNIFE